MKINILREGPILLENKILSCYKCKYLYSKIELDITRDYYCGYKLSGEYIGLNCITPEWCPLKNK